MDDIMMIDEPTSPPGHSFEAIDSDSDSDISFQSSSSIGQKHRNIPSPSSIDNEKVLVKNTIEIESEPTDETVLSQDPDEYVVEKILGKRKSRISNGYEYLIKWAGWTDDGNTWEPIENLSCPDLLKEFEDNWEESRRRRMQAAAKKKLLKSEETRERKSNNPIRAAARGKIYNEDIKCDLPVENEDVSDDDPNGLCGFERGLMPEKIVGVTKVDNQLVFLMRWHGCRYTDLVPAEEANLKCPNIVIKYYEGRLSWTAGSEPDSQNLI
ncbi:chromobox protein homolog 5-like [Brevipalpus obovatus]|uniref:chromobox protein homolog 5-like n=1 Tax=Brevipalpus obovatus TaxID=246614 RepID=UPI003D9F2D5E